MLVAVINSSDTDYPKADKELDCLTGDSTDLVIHCRTIDWVAQRWAFDSMVSYKCFWPDERDLLLTGVDFLVAFGHSPDILRLVLEAKDLGLKVRHFRGKEYGRKPGNRTLPALPAAKAKGRGRARKRRADPAEHADS